INGDWGGGKLLRSKGFFWLATRPRQAGQWSQAGGIAHYGLAGTFWRAIPQDNWPQDPQTRAHIQEKWVEPFGDMRQELESHMQKEEQVLFPMLARGHGAMAVMPITMMRMEHDDHGVALERLMALTHDLTLPRAACNTWRALYLGIGTFKQDLMAHIHLENNILFENAEAEAVRPRG
ncbi:hemerythrin domain-containing protein, partial [Klebsiella pneumoniae]|uniref:hemerythrin domain-containing protein n=1 Tax=Klebsiella pneumoniae TaxID=573 RepID=UPI000E065BCF